MIDLKDWITGIREGQIDTGNLNFKVDSWFGKNNLQKDRWKDFCNNCKEAHRVEPDLLDDYYNNFSSSKEFVDFINDNVGYDDNEVNYKDQFMNIIRQYSGI